MRNEIFIARKPRQLRKLTCQTSYWYLVAFGVHVEDMKNDSATIRKVFIRLQPPANLPSRKDRCCCCCPEFPVDADDEICPLVLLPICVLFIPLFWSSTAELLRLAFAAPPGPSIGVLWPLFASTDTPPMVPGKGLLLE